MIDFEPYERRKELEAAAILIVMAIGAVVLILVLLSVLVTLWWVS